MIYCKSYSKMTNDKDEIIFEVFVESENQQRMLLGK